MPGWFFPMPISYPFAGLPVNWVGRVINGRPDAPSSRTQHIPQAHAKTLVPSYPQNAKQAVSPLTWLQGGHGPSNDANPYGLPNALNIRLCARSRRAKNASAWTIASRLSGDCGSSSGSHVAS